MRKYILTTGGTGGHIFPAIALAEELKQRHPQSELLFIGSEYGPESRLAKNANIKFYGLPVRGFLGRGLKSVSAAFGMGIALARALAIIKNFNPDAIAAFGGYASFAPALAARFFHVPLLVHEQNAIAGTANKILGRWAKKICVSLPDTAGFNQPVTFTGNPVRAAIFKNSDTAKIKKDKKLRLLVIGGSQGAHALNEYVIRIMAQLKDDVEFLHQTGKADYERVREAYKTNGLSAERAQVFIDDMAGAYHWADLALCRAGASTCAELCASGLPAILVPFPAAIHDHQTLNAQALVKAGAARLVPETDIDEALDHIKTLMANSGQLEEMSCAAMSLGQKDAAKLIACELEKISKSHEE